MKNKDVNSNTYKVNKSSLLISKNSTKKSINMPTYISNSIISKSSSTLNTIKNLESSITKTKTSISGKSTSLLVQNTLSSNIKDYILSSSLSSKSSSTSISKLSFSESFSSNLNTQYQSPYSNKLIFNLENDIMKAKINVNKGELEEHLDSIIKQVDIGKRYEINGDDYNITITSIDDIDDFKSTYADLSICEQILRKVNNISEDRILTILQIEIDKLNSQSLTNQVEYVVYDDEKKQLDLSCCKSTPIKITYEIILLAFKFTDIIIKNNFK